MKLRILLLAVLLLLLAFSLRLTRTADLGLQADEGVHIVAAAQVADGQVLYRDLFENRTPGFEWLLAGLFRLAGVHWFLGRLVSVLAATLTAATLLGAGRLVIQGQGRCWAGFLAAFLFALAPLAIFWSRFAMLESVETAVATFAIFAGAIALRRRQTAFWLAVGLFSGIAILVKQSGIVLLPVFVFVLLFAREKRGLIAYLVGVSGLIGLFLTVLWWQGALADFLRFLSGAERLTPLANLPAKGGAFWAWAKQQPILPLALLGGVALWKRPSSSTWLITLWAAAEFGALLLPPEVDFGWGGSSHYVLPALAAGSLLAGCGIVHLWRVVQVKRGYLIWGFSLLLLGIFSGSGWLRGLNKAIWQTAYPQPSMIMEQQVGQAVSLVTTSDESLVVLGNSGFYYWANRSPASKFFHFPSYFAESALLPEVEDSIQDALGHNDTGAVLISRLHLDERLTPPLLAALGQSWVPAVHFEYPYQRDMFLYLRPSFTNSAKLPLAHFVDGVQLTAVSVKALDETNYLVELTWLAKRPLPENEIVFVHLLRPDGSLAAQHDGVPMAGFRPTTSWQPGEFISDWHWLTLPIGENSDAYRLSIGLYNAESGTRRLLQNDETKGDSDESIGDSFVIPLNEAIVK